MKRARPIHHCFVTRHVIPSRRVCAARARSSTARARVREKFARRKYSDGPTRPVPDDQVSRTTLRMSPVDPLIVSPELPHGGGCVLYFVNGVVSTLELYSHAGDFHRELREWSLAEWKKLW